MKQTILETNGWYEVLDPWFSDNRVSSVLLVCGKSVERQKINEYVHALPERLGVKVVRFTGFQPNPLYENVLAGLERYRGESCDAIMAVGGGSAIDVAKCIRLFSGMDGVGSDGEYLKQTAVPNGIPFLAVPTTAGTGSEATRFAVIYYNGEKQSVTDPGCIPDTVLLDAGMLRSLPEYQKKATMLDALSHAIESFWSVNSTEESRLYSRKAIELIMANKDACLANTDEGNLGMLTAANIAGKAINITQTTAGHAMCYKITALFGCAHGHAAALCNRILFPWMLENTAGCCDPRGERYLSGILQEIACALGCSTAEQGAQKLSEMIDAWGLDIPAATEEQFERLKNSVNPVRLKNHPIALDAAAISMLYHRILREKRNES